MRKKNLITACLVIGAFPALLLLQQFLMPRKSPAEPRHLIRKFDGKLLLATEEGLEYNRNNAAHIAYAAAIYASQGRHRTAEKWLQLGAGEFRYPSIMLFTVTICLTGKGSMKQRGGITSLCTAP